MAKLHSSEFTWLTFDEEGKVTREDVAALEKLVATLDLTDIVVMSHGWKNTEAEAEKLYGGLWKNAIGSYEVIADGQAEKTLVVGVIWPAKKYETDFDAKSPVSAATANALAVHVGAAVKDLDEHAFGEVLKSFTDFIGPSAGGVVSAAREAGKGITANTAADLVDEGIKAMGMRPAEADPELKIYSTPCLNAAAQATNAQALLSGLAAPPGLRVSNTVGAAQGLQTSVSSLFSGARAAVGRFLNQLTYYEMKKRAGVVGKSLAIDVLQKLSPTSPMRLHLVGHSFGARVVTAAANEGLGNPSLAFYSLTLLQGAFSQNGLAGIFAPGLAGAFPNVVGKLQGPIAITHTHNDRACTIAYAIASRLSRDMTKSIGDKDDLYGAMGANGPQHLSETMVVTGNAYAPFAPKAKMVNTFLADGYIVETSNTDAHNNVANKTVGRLLAEVVTRKT